MSRSKQARLGVETLEGREVPAVWFNTSGGGLYVYGTTGNDNVQVSTSYTNNQWMASVTENGRVTSTLPYSRITRIYFWGYEGNDTFRTTHHAPVDADGGLGNDRIYGSSSSDILRGGRDIDSLYGYGGNDELYGGNGAGAGDSFGGFLYWGNYLFGGEGDDRLYGAEGSDELFGGRGSDSLYGYGGDDKLWAADVEGGRDDTSSDPETQPRDGSYVRNVLEGGAGADELHGSASNDRLVGGNGSDRLYGYGGQDTLHGDGAGSVLALAGNDELYGGGGIDKLVGGAGNDKLWAGGTTDPVSTLNTPETHKKGPELRVEGTTWVGGTTWSNGTEVSVVDVYNYRERADVGDRLYGDTEDESEAAAYQGDGNDHLYGDDFTDFLFGGSGNDVMEGGAGADLLFGGLGDVLYAHTAASATDDAAGWVVQRSVRRIVRNDVLVWDNYSIWLYPINGNLDIDALLGQGGKDTLYARDGAHDHLDAGNDGWPEWIYADFNDPDLSSDDDVPTRA